MLIQLSKMSARNATSVKKPFNTSLLHTQIMIKMIYHHDNLVIYLVHTDVLILYRFVVTPFMFRNIYVF